MGSANRLKLAFRANCFLRPRRHDGVERSEAVGLARLADDASIAFMLPIGRWKGLPAPAAATAWTLVIVTIGRWAGMNPETDRRSVGAIIPEGNYYGWEVSSGVPAAMREITTRPISAAQPTA